MTVDLETLCKAYLMFMDKEFADRLDKAAERKEKEQKERSLTICKDMPEEEAEYHAKTYRVSMMEGFFTVATELKRLINDEMVNEYREFEKSRGYLCPNCDNTCLLSKSDYVPVLNGSFVISYDCPKCGFIHEFPKAILVRDIFTEYANREKERDEGPMADL